MRASTDSTRPQSGWLVPHWATYMEMAAPAGCGNTEFEFTAAHGEFEYCRDAQGGYMHVDNHFEMDPVTRTVRPVFGEVLIRCWQFGDEDERDFDLHEARAMHAMIRDSPAATLPAVMLEIFETLSELLAAYDDAPPVTDTVVT